MVDVADRSVCSEPPKADELIGGYECYRLPRLGEAVRVRGGHARRDRHRRSRRCSRSRSRSAAAAADCWLIVTAEPARPLVIACCSRRPDAAAQASFGLASRPRARPAGVRRGLDRDALLLERVAVAERDRVVVGGLAVDGDAPGCRSRPGGGSACRSSRPGRTRRRSGAQRVEDLAGPLGHALLVDQRHHGDLDRRQPRVQAEDGPGAAPTSSTS